MKTYKFTKDQICPKYFDTPKSQLICLLDLKNTFDKKCKVSFNDQGCEIEVDRKLSTDEEKQLALILSDFDVFDEDQKARKEEHLKKEKKKKEDRENRLEEIKKEKEVKKKEKLEKDKEKLRVRKEREKREEERLKKEEKREEERLKNIEEWVDA